MGQFLAIFLSILVMGRATVLVRGPPGRVYFVRTETARRPILKDRETGFFGPKIGRFLAYFGAKFGYTFGTFYCQMLAMGWATKMGQKAPKTDAKKTGLPKDR